MKKRRIRRLFSALLTLVVIVGTFNLPMNVKEARADGPGQQQIGTSSAYWEVKDGVLYITGSGNLPDYSAYYDQPWNTCSDSITSIIIDDEITGLGNSNFESLNNVTSITVPDSVTSIGKMCFYDTGIESVVINGSNITINEDAFGYCRNLKNVSFSGEVHYDHNGAFMDCKNLETVTFSSINRLGESDFCRCPKLEKIVINNIPDGFTIHKRLFGYSADGIPPIPANLYIVIPDGKSIADLGISDLNLRSALCGKVVTQSQYDAWKVGDGKITQRNHDFDENTVFTKIDENTHQWTCSTCGGVAQGNHDFIAQDGTCKTDVEACASCGVKNIAYSGITVNFYGDVYDGNSNRGPSFDVKNGSTELTIGKDYSYQYDDGIKYPGEYTITITGIGDYAGSRTETWTIEKADVDPDFIKALTYDQVKKSTYSGTERVITLEPREGIEGLGTITTYYKLADSEEEMTTTAPKDAGTYEIYAVVAEGANYKASSEPICIGGFGILPDDSEITIPETTISKTYGDEAFSLGATKTGDGTLTYASSDEAVATVDSTGKVTITGEGTATITVSMAATRNYNEAESKTVTLNVEKGTLVEGTDYTIPTDLTAECGATLSSVDFDDAMFTWKDGTTKLAAGDLEAGATVACKAIIKKEHYNDKEVEVNVAVTHSLSATHIEGTETHASQCSACKKNYNVTACSGGVATCIAKAKCSVCKAEYGEKDLNNHKLDKYESFDSAKHTKKCSDCGYVSEDVNNQGNHDFSVYVSNRNGTHKVTCSACDAVDPDQTAVACSGTGADCYTKATCSSCGEQFGSFDSTKHSGGSEVKNKKDATCTEIGYTGDTYCKGCNTKLQNGNVTMALGHSFDNGVITTQPTTTAEGVKTYTCSRCGDTKTEAVAKLPDDGAEKQKEKEQQITNFATRMYSVALGRTPDQGGLDYWSDGLKSTKMDGASIARGFICSKEFKAKNLNDEEFLNVLYSTFFDREPDPDGKAYWLNVLKKGSSREKVLSGFVNSKEFGGLCESYGIARGTMEADGSNIYNANVRDFVLRNYEKALGRNGEVEGVEYWSYRINKGMIEPRDVAISFFHSKEYLDKNLDDAAYVETLYETFLGRSSDAEGKAYWIQKLREGSTRDKVLDGFAYSKEFGGILQSFGLK